MPIDKEHPVQGQGNRGKILLALLPYWDPLLPPQGIAHLKHFLQHHHYIVKTTDANTEMMFKQIYNRYFERLKEYVPVDKRGNFYNIGHDVLRNHMLAHLHYETESSYIALVGTIVFQTYFTPLHRDQVLQLNRVIEEFYRRLYGYFNRLLSEEKPAVLGLSVYRDTIAPSLFVFRLTREKYPHIKTVMGGTVFSDHLLPGTPNFEFFLEKTPYIDKIIIGPGQNLFLQWLQGQLPESQRVYTIRDLEGEPPVEPGLNVPDLSDFDPRRDYPYQAAQASSGCPYRCSFCNVRHYFGPYRPMSLKQTLAQMDRLYREYGTQLFYMNDALLNPVITDLAREMLTYRIPFYWDGYLRVDPTVGSTENTLLWRCGGFYRARLGVESGSQAVLDAMGKQITPAMIQSALAGLAQAGIKTTAYWVIGHPGETEADFLQTLELLEECQRFIYEAECNPFIYGYDGQADSPRWKSKQKLLYPPEAKDLLIIQSWIVAEEPTREETYRRINRFVRHCEKLGIPNPYSLQEIYLADQRWKKLHKNAVPPMVEFQNNNRLIEECRQVNPLVRTRNKPDDEADFGF